MLGGFDDPFEHGPRVGRRLADDAQDFGGRGLPLQRLPRLVDEPRVLHRDQRLARERARKRDLPVRIRPNLVAIEGENAHDLPAVDERHDKDRPGSVDLDAADDQGNPVLVGLRRLEILNVEKGSILGVAAQEVHGGHGLEVGTPADRG